jgi:hypothetical protein
VNLVVNVFWGIEEAAMVAVGGQNKKILVVVVFVDGDPVESDRSVGRSVDPTSTRQLLGLRFRDE